MEDYITVKEAAIKWKVTERQVQIQIEYKEQYK